MPFHSPCLTQSLLESGLGLVTNGPSSWKRFHPHFPLLLALLSSPPKVEKRKERHGIQNQRVPTPWHSGKGKSQDTVKRSMVVRTWGEGWMNGWNTEDFSGSEATFCCRSVAESHPILCNSMDCNPPGSSVLHDFLCLLKFMSLELVILSNHLILCVVPNGSFMSL